MNIDNNTNSIIRSKAPLRLGLGGGGTDVDPYCSEYGGCVLNGTINMYTYCIIRPTNNGVIEISAPDIDIVRKYNAKNKLPLDGILDLHKAVYNRVVRQFNIGIPLSFELITYSDAPPGSGLGSSSAMVVAILKAFTEWLRLPLGEYDLASISYEIERKEVGLLGGRQDQYAAAFGGFNFMEFSSTNSIINPLRVKRWIIDELQSYMILFYSGVSRDSEKIISEQQTNVIANKRESIQSMHELKKQSYLLKEQLLKGDIYKFAKILKLSWESKRKMANSISNNIIENALAAAYKNGAISGKVSGAGGGGFIMFFIEPEKRVKLINVLNDIDGKVIKFDFTEGGCHGWSVNNTKRHLIVH